MKAACEYSLIQMSAITCSMRSELDAAIACNELIMSFVEARTRMLLSQLKLKDNSDFKIAFSIKSFLAPMEEHRG